MSVATIQFQSQALGKDVSYQAILPVVGEGPFPVVVQLHGLGGDAGAWIQRSNLVRHVEPYPLVVILPDGGTSGYLNWKDADRFVRNRYEDFIVTDLVDHVRRQLNVTAGPWAIGGASFGGYGALRLGLKYPDRFASIWAHSSALHFHKMVDPAMIDDLDDANVFRQAERAATRGSGQAIAFDCGVDDEHIITYHRELDTLMDRIGLNHRYVENPGGSNWTYWDEHVPEALAQHAKTLLNTGSVTDRAGRLPHHHEEPRP